MKKIYIPLLLLTSTSGLCAQINTQALEACSMIENDHTRLTCYDKVMMHKTPSVNQQQQTSAKPVVIAPQTQAVKPASEFGLEHKNIAEGSEKEQINHVLKIKKSPHGEMIITMDNGQVWRQIGTDRLRVQTDSQVFIRRGALNSFLLKLADGNKSIRVKRIK